VENFGWNFSANIYSEPATIVLSSSAMVTAAEKVQEDEMRQIYEVHKDFRSLQKVDGSHLPSQVCQMQDRFCA
jgi:hypothetical protein